MNATDCSTLLAVILTLTLTYDLDFQYPASYGPDPYTFMKPTSKVSWFKRLGVKKLETDGRDQSPSWHYRKTSWTIVRLRWAPTVGWQRGVVVSGVRQWAKLTHVGPGYNWDWWPSSSGYTILGCNQPTRSTQPCIPPGSLYWVPASAGVRAGMSPLPGGRYYGVIPYGMWVPVAVRRVANCYTVFTFLLYFSI